MPDWRNFSTVEKWAKDNAGATDCSSKCSECEKEWKVIRDEGRGEEAIHMLELPKEERTPCGLPYRFVCDTCYLTESLL